MSKQAAVIEAKITIEGLSKRYHGAPKLALDNLNLSVYPGEIYGFLGPNGAGKSTTIRLLMNYIKPSVGKATILGQDSVTASTDIKKSIGYLSGELAMYPKMTGRQFLAYMGDLQPAKSQVYTNELVTRLKVDLNKRLGELSRGNKQKIGIVQAFMHQPQVLILDEPTSGLDPLMQEVFYELLSEAKQRKTAIFMSSHILSEVQKICDRIGIIREGKLVRETNIAEMSAEAAQTFDITFVGKPPIAQLKKLKGVREVKTTGNTLSLHIHGNLSPLFGILAKHDVLRLDARHLDLEEMFLSFYQEKKDDTAY